MIIEPFHTLHTHLSFITKKCLLFACAHNLTKKRYTHKGKCTALWKLNSENKSQLKSSTGYTNKRNTKVVSHCAKS